MLTFNLAPINRNPGFATGLLCNDRQPYPICFGEYKLLKCQKKCYAINLLNKLLPRILFLLHHCFVYEHFRCLDMDGLDCSENILLTHLICGGLQTWSKSLYSGTPIFFIFYTEIASV